MLNIVNRKFTARLSTIFVDTLWYSNIDPALTWLVTIHAFTYCTINLGKCGHAFECWCHVLRLATQGHLKIYPEMESVGPIFKVPPSHSWPMFCLSQNNGHDDTSL